MITPKPTHPETDTPTPTRPHTHTDEHDNSIVTGSLLTHYGASPCYNMMFYCTLQGLRLGMAERVLFYNGKDHEGVFIR